MVQCYPSATGCIPKWSKRQLVLRYLSHNLFGGVVLFLGLKKQVRLCGQKSDSSRHGVMVNYAVVDANLAMKHNKHEY
jgi:hypothetical protein